MKSIPVNLDLLISPEAASRLRSAGLHKVAAAMLKNEGFKVAEELTMKDVVTALGIKLRQKNAEYTRIREGFASMRALEKSAGMFGKKTLAQAADKARVAANKGVKEINKTVNQLKK